MSEAPISSVLVTLSTHPTLEESVIDWLLERESGPGFTSFDIRGHSARHDHLSVAEQVSGRQRRMRFEVVLEAAALTAFLAALETEFAGADVHYWVTPTVAAGDLGTRH